MKYQRIVRLQYQRIKDLRIDHDLTQKQVAAELGCNREVYRRYESGIREILVWTLIKLAQLYDCSVDYLLGVSDIKRHFKQ